MGMDQYLLIPFLMGWTSINPSYFDVNRRGTRFWHTAIYETTSSWMFGEIFHAMVDRTQGPDSSLLPRRAGSRTSRPGRRSAEQRCSPCDTSRWEPGSWKMTEMNGRWFGTFFIFPNSWDDDPIWRSHIFQRSWNHQPGYEWNMNGIWMGDWWVKLFYSYGIYGI